MAEELKLCINCKHSTSNKFSGSGYICLHTTGVISLVDGTEMVYGVDCALMRSAGNACGLDGTLFEAVS